VGEERDEKESLGSVLVGREYLEILKAGEIRLLRLKNRVKEQGSQLFNRLSTGSCL